MRVFEWEWVDMVLTGTIKRVSAKMLALSNPMKGLILERKSPSFMPWDVHFSSYTLELLPCLQLLLGD